MRTDFENLEDGDVIILHPNDANPFSTTSPAEVVFYKKCFFDTCKPINERHDYDLSDVLEFNHGFTVNDH